MAAHDEDYELDVDGEGPVVLRMRAGAIELVNVGDVVPAFASYTRVTITDAGFDALAGNELTPAQAADQGAMLVRSRLYGGGQFMGLLRLAQTTGAFLQAHVPTPRGPSDSGGS